MVDRIDNLELINPEMLTPVARKFAELIGIEQTIALFKFRGGLDTYIPMRGESLLLSEVLTTESLAILAASDLAGTEIYLPKADRALQQIRNIAIRSAREHHSVPVVARDFGLSRRQVINIIHDDDDDDDPTVDMFG